MKEIACLLLCVMVTSTIKELHGAKISGDWNMTTLIEKIFLKGSQRLKPNKLPDMTSNDKVRSRFPGPDAAVGRRFLKDIISDRRKLIQNIANDDSAIPADNGILYTYTDLRQVENVRRGASGAVTQKPDSEKKKEVKDDEEKKRIRVNRQHASRLGDIRDYLTNQYAAIDYIYDEVNRIKRDHVIKDQLRIMVEYLSRPYMEELTKSVFKCLKEKRKTELRIRDIWKHQIPNTVLINVPKDPYNDGISA